MLHQNEGGIRKSRPDAKEQKMKMQIHTFLNRRNSFYGFRWIYKTSEICIQTNECKHLSNAMRSCAQKCLGIPDGPLEVWEAAASRVLTQRHTLGALVSLASQLQQLHPVPNNTTEDHCTDQPPEVFLGFSRKNFKPVFGFSGVLYSYTVDCALHQNTESVWLHCSTAGLLVQGASSRV